MKGVGALNYQRETVIHNIITNCIALAIIIKILIYFVLLLSMYISYMYKLMVNVEMRMVAAV